MIIHTLDILTNRQIDAIIASKVIGEKIRITLTGGQFEPLISDHQRPVPYYSADAGAAWHLVLWTVKLGRSIGLNYLVETQEWRCLIQDEKFKIHRAIDRTLERAICRAILMQAGILKEEALEK